MFAPYVSNVPLILFWGCKLAKTVVCPVVHQWQWAVLFTFLSTLLCTTGAFCVWFCVCAFCARGTGCKGLKLQQKNSNDWDQNFSVCDRNFSKNRDCKFSVCDGSFTNDWDFASDGNFSNYPRPSYVPILHVLSSKKLQLCIVDCGAQPNSFLSYFKYTSVLHCLQIPGKFLVYLSMIYAGRSIVQCWQIISLADSLQVYTSSGV